MLQVKDIHLSYGPRPVLDGVGLTVAAGEKVGLIGVNGAGKSSLLKILAGIQSADRGTVLLPRTLGYLAQDVAHEGLAAGGGLVRDFIFSAVGLDAALAEYEALAQRITAAPAGELPALLARFEVAQDTLDRLGYYDAESRAEQLVAGLGLGGVTLDRPVRTLSGGQKTKLALARLLFQAPDLLLLDEPTNFLDLEAAEWLMAFLGSYRGALLIISHDLELLDRSITKILRLNEITHKLEEYRGTYSQYLTRTGDEQALAERTRAQQDREIARLRKTSDRLRGYGATRVRQRVAVDRRVAELQAGRPVAPQSSHAMRLEFPVRQASGRAVLSARGLCKRYGSQLVFHDLRLDLERGERLVVVGLNGAGKTTLLRCLLDPALADAGAVTWDERAQIGYYAQENEGLDYGATVLAEATAALPHDARRVRAVLGRFLFTGDRVFQTVGTLSGGEKTRLALAKMVLAGPNVLLLDEPTTHLDVQSRRIIGEALGAYNGTLLAVTHDVEFVRDLRPDTLLLMPEGRRIPYAAEHDALLARA